MLTKSALDKRTLCVILKIWLYFREKFQKVGFEITLIIEKKNSVDREGTVGQHDVSSTTCNGCLIHSLDQTLRRPKYGARYCGSLPNTACSVEKSILIWWDPRIPNCNSSLSLNMSNSQQAESN